MLHHKTHLNNCKERFLERHECLRRAQGEEGGAHVWAPESKGTRTTPQAGNPLKPTAGEAEDPGEAQEHWRCMPRGGGPRRCQQKARHTEPPPAQQRRALFLGRAHKEVGGGGKGKRSGSWGTGSGVPEPGAITALPAGPQARSHVPLLEILVWAHLGQDSRCHSQDSKGSCAIYNEHEA